MLLGKALIIFYLQRSQYFLKLFTVLHFYSLYHLQSESEYIYYQPREVASILMGCQSSENLIEFSTENNLIPAYFS